MRGWYGFPMRPSEARIAWIAVEWLALSCVSYGSMSSGLSHRGTRRHNGFKAACPVNCIFAHRVRRFSETPPTCLKEVSLRLGVATTALCSWR
jgi:hypothetical protein